LFHPEEAYASSYITFAVFDWFISAGEGLLDVSFDGRVGLFVVW